VDRMVLWPTDRSVKLYERAGFTFHGEVMELRCERDTTKDAEVQS
jgi:hypothetical protein